MDQVAGRQHGRLGRRGRRRGVEAVDQPLLGRIDHRQGVRRPVVVRRQGRQQGPHIAGPALGGGAGEQAGGEMQRGLDAVVARLEAEHQRPGVAGRPEGAELDAGAGRRVAVGRRRAGIAHRGVEARQQLVQRRLATQVRAQDPRRRGGGAIVAIVAVPELEVEMVLAAQACQHQAPGDAAGGLDGAAPGPDPGLDRPGRRGFEDPADIVEGRRGCALGRTGGIGRQFQPASVLDVRHVVRHRGDIGVWVLSFHDLVFCPGNPG
ncbi:MAG: hypothetical protein EOP73_25470 [Variovorax sp.]|nr:MAG: hypothetical protein EOP73_25470 [Variovorax sp.]